MRRLTERAAQALSLLSFMVVVLFAGGARAQNLRIVTVDLDVAIAERPTHVCVVHATPDSTAKAFGDVFDATKSLRLAYTASAPQVGADKTIFEEWSFTSSRVREQFPSRGPAESEAERSIRTALEKLSADESDRSACASGSRACKPVFTITSISSPPTPKYMRCTANSATPRNSQARVLVVDVGFLAPTASARELNLVALVGNVLTLRFQATGASGVNPAKPKATELQPRDEAIATVLGGHFVHGVTASAVADRIQLQLTPRCHLREIRLPEPVPPANNHYLEVSTCRGKRRLTCTRALGERVQIKLPDGTGDDHVTAAIRPGKFEKRNDADNDADGKNGDGKSGDGKKGDGNTNEASAQCSDDPASDATAIFEARWSSRVPPAELELKPVRTTFRWKPSCNYPFWKVTRQGVSLDCPKARLTDLGLDCKRGDWNQHEKTCSYQCPQTDRTEPFSFPTAVTFTIEELLWTDTLHHVNEVLSSYDRDGGRLKLELPDWPSKIGERDVDRVTHIEIDVPGAGTHRYPPRESLITVPGAACDALLRYRVTGDRAYDDKDVPLMHGKITLPAPRVTARVFTVSAALGGGLMVPTQAHPFDTGVLTPRPYGAVHLAGRWRYRNVGWLSIETRGSYLFAEQSYGPLHAPENVKSRDIPRTFYSRFLLSVRPVFTFLRLADKQVDLIPDPFAIGISRPLAESDSVHVGETQVFWSPSLSARWYVIRSGFLDVGARWIVPERLFSYRTDFTGTPIRTTHHLAQFMIDLALGVSVF